MIGSSHLVALGRFKPAERGDGEGEYIQIPIIVWMLRVEGIVRRATEDETGFPGLVKWIAEIAKPSFLHLESVLYRCASH
jgi:hypothetical protein